MQTAGRKQKETHHHPKPPKDNCCDAKELQVKQSWISEVPFIVITLSLAINVNFFIKSINYLCLKILFSSRNRTVTSSTLTEGFCKSLI